jgi:hypothetical protein
VPPPHPPPTPPPAAAQEAVGARDVEIVSLDVPRMRGGGEVLLWSAEARRGSATPALPAN